MIFVGHEGPQKSCLLLSSLTLNLCFHPCLSLWGLLSPTSSSSSSRGASVLHRSASWLPMMLMLMSSPPPSIPGWRATAAPPFSPRFRLTDWPTDGQTDVGRLEHPCIHPPVHPSGRGSSLLLPPPVSHSSPLIDAPLRQQPTQAPLLKPRRTPSLSLHPSSLSGGFSMYGCATDRDAVGWRQEERKTGEKTIQAAEEIEERSERRTPSFFEWAEDSPSAVVDAELLR